jgi:hypothetical protein
MQPSSFLSASLQTEDNFVLPCHLCHVKLSDLEINHTFGEGADHHPAIESEYFWLAVIRDAEDSPAQTAGILTGQAISAV